MMAYSQLLAALILMRWRLLRPWSQLLWGKRRRESHCRRNLADCKTGCYIEERVAQWKYTKF